MPRIDPFSGCETMTMTEFLEEEGQRCGKTGGEVLNEIFATMEADSARIKEEQRQPDVALQILLPAAQFDREEYDQWRSYVDGLRENPDESWKQLEIESFDSDPRNAMRPPLPVEVLEVQESYHYQNFDGTTIKITARVRCDDGATRIVKYVGQHSHGSRVEPPDDEQTVEWTDANGGAGIQS